MSFIDDIGKVASDVGRAVGGAAEDVAGAVGDGVKAVGETGVGEAVGSVVSDIGDGALDVVDAIPNPVKDALAVAGSVALFAASPPLFAAGAMGAGALARKDEIIDKLEGGPEKRARGERNMALADLEREKERELLNTEEKKIKEELQAREQKMRQQEMQSNPASEARRLMASDDKP